MTSVPQQPDPMSIDPHVVSAMANSVMPQDDQGPEPAGPHPEAPESPMDAMEVDARERLGLSLAIMGERVADAVKIACEANMSQDVKHYADSALSLVQAIALLYPLEQVDEGETPVNTKAKP